LEVAKSLERCKGEINFLKVFEVTKVLASVKKFRKSKFIILGESEKYFIIFHCVRSENNFLTFPIYSTPVLMSDLRLVLFDALLN